MPSCAVLVLGAHNPENLRVLLKYFDVLQYDVYIHVDEKVDIAAFEFAKNDYSGGNAEIIAERVNIYWRGFSMIVATVALISSARRRRLYDYYILLSDDTLPLIPVSEASKRLSVGGNILHAWPNPGARPRYDNFYMFDSNATSIRWLPLEVRTISADTCEKIHRLGALRNKGKAPIPQLYHGSQWWRLTDAAVALFLKSYTSDVWLRESFEFSDVPDEMYIQTVVTSYLQNTSTELVHTDWSVPHGPKVFTEPRELAELRGTGCLFVRKIRFEPLAAEKYIEELIAG